MDIKKITNIVLIALIVVAVIVLGLCMVMDPGTIKVSDNTVQPDPHTGLLLGFSYVLLGITVAVTLFSAITSFMTKLANDKQKTLIMLGGVLVLAFILLLTYLTGDGTKMNIVGYEGDENSEGYLKMCDMFLRSAYILVALAVIAIIASPLVKKLK